VSFSPVPQYAYRELTDIPPDFLKKLGVKLLMLDLDNTVAAYTEHIPPVGVARWIAEVMERGITLYILSNSRKKRVDTFAQALQIGCMKGARKPSPKGVRSTAAQFGFSSGESALAGDQVYTDVLAANRAGAISIVVRPRRFSNPFLAIRYALEAPFRAMCGNKMYCKDKR